jgi:hypothetical protein
VKGLAKGLQIKEKAKKHFCKLKAEAEEICQQAKDCAEHKQPTPAEGQAESCDSASTSPK